MKQYSLLIIDDGLVSENRKTIYQKILGSGFDLHFIETGADLNKITTTKVHGYVLDMVLDNWVGDKKQQKNAFTQAIELIGNKGPVFLVSSRWSPEVVGWLNNSKDKVKVEHFYEWREFQEFYERLEAHNDSNGLFIPINLNIEREINKFFARDLTQKKSNEPITILQISDLQFGDKLTDEDSGLLQYSIPSYLSEHKIIVDFICITGDVTYSGLPNEFDLATNWINKLCSKIFHFENFKPRILLIPGNHDVNLLLNAADTVSYSFKDLKLAPIVVNEISKQQHHHYGLSPFKEMAYSLTKDTNWFTIENHLCFVNEKFLHWGIRFIHLNSVVELSYTKNSLASVPNDFLEKICDCINFQENEQDIFTIILSHHGPDDFKPNHANSTNRWSSVRTLIDNSKTDLFLYGHHHGFSRTYGDNEEGDYIKKTIFHRTSTLLLNEKAREVDSTTKMHTQQRGFSIIKLERENGIVKKSRDLIIDKYELRGSKISKLE